MIDPTPSKEAREAARLVCIFISEDIGCRRGIGKEWRSIDDDVRAEIEARWADRIALALDAARRDGVRAGLVKANEWVRGAIEGDCAEACCRGFREIAETIDAEAARLAEGGGA